MPNPMTTDPIGELLEAAKVAWKMIAGKEGAHELYVAVAAVEQMRRQCKRPTEREFREADGFHGDLSTPYYYPSEVNPLLDLLLGARNEDLGARVNGWSRDDEG